MDTTEKILTIQQEIKRYKPIIEPLWEQVLDSEVTRYPILIFSTLPIEAGVLIMDRQMAPGPWSVSMSSLEEFNVKKLIFDEKVRDFQKIYKDPELHYCAFVISDLGTQFLFIPR
jgi:hypothetical protein